MIAEKVDITKLKPSELLRLAVADTRKCWRSPRYHVYMGIWHVPLDNGICSVCVAGAVMAKELNQDRKLSVGPESYSHLVKKRLRGIDCFRKGFVAEGMRLMEVLRDKAIRVEDEISTMQGNGAKHFWFHTMHSHSVVEGDGDNLHELLKAMTWLARQLKKRGL